MVLLAIGTALEKTKGTQSRQAACYPARQCAEFFVASQHTGITFLDTRHPCFSIDTLREVLVFSRQLPKEEIPYAVPGQSELVPAYFSAGEMTSYRDRIFSSISGGVPQRPFDVLAAYNTFHRDHPLSILQNGTHLATW